MKKRIIIAVAFTACLALCAAVWPQAETCTSGSIRRFKRTTNV